MTRRRKPAKRQRRITYGQVGGFSPGLIVGGYWQSRLWDHQSLGGLSNQASQENILKTATGSGRIICTWQTQILWGVNHSIVLSCRQYKKNFVGLDKCQLEDGPWTQWTPTSLCPPNTTPATWIATWRRATHVGDGSLALGVQEETPTAGSPTLR